MVFRLLFIFYITIIIDKTIDINSLHSLYMIIIIIITTMTTVTTEERFGLEGPSWNPFVVFPFHNAKTQKRKEQGYFVCFLFFSYFFAFPAFPAYLLDFTAILSISSHCKSRDSCRVLRVCRFTVVLIPKRTPLLPPKIK